jgi:hypothetical protein
LILRSVINDKDLSVAARATRALDGARQQRATVPSGNDDTDLWHQAGKFRIENAKAIS